MTKSTDDATQHRISEGARIWGRRLRELGGAEPPQGGLACQTKPALWDSTLLEDHTLARMGCQPCFMREDCRAIAADNPLGVTGTFGGDLFVDGTPKLVHQ